MEQIHYSKRVVKKTFSGATTKEAYMKAVKWYASNVIANDKLSGVQAQFTKNKIKPEVVMELFVTLPEQEVSDSHCECCKEMHHAFFINQENDCSRCAMLGYRRRMEQKISVKVGYYKEQLGQQRRVQTWNRYGIK